MIKTAYKLFYRTKEGLMFPPMVARENCEPTPIGVWLTAHEPVPIDKDEIDALFPDVPQYLRRYHVQCGGKGTRTSKGRLSYRPGWHLSETPDAPQFRRRDGSWPEELVWALCEYEDGSGAMKHIDDGVNAPYDVPLWEYWQYQANLRMFYGFFKNGKWRVYKKPHYALGGLNHLPYGGSYRYRTNPRPDSPLWIICEKMRVIKIL